MTTVECGTRILSFNITRRVGSLNWIEFLEADDVTEESYCEFVGKKL